VPSSSAASKTNDAAVMPTTPPPVLPMPWQAVAQRGRRANAITPQKGNRQGLRLPRQRRSRSIQADLRFQRHPQVATISAANDGRSRGRDDRRCDADKVGRRYLPEEGKSMTPNWSHEGMGASTRLPSRPTSATDTERMKAYPRGALTSCSPTRDRVCAGSPCLCRADCRPHRKAPADHRRRHRVRKPCHPGG